MVAANVTIHSIAISTESDPDLDRLSDVTGGSSYFYSVSDTSNALHEALTEIGQRGVGRFCSLFVGVLLRFKQSKLTSRHRYLDHGNAADTRHCISSPSQYIDTGHGRRNRGRQLPFQYFV